MIKSLISVCLSTILSILISELYTSFYYGKLLEDFSIADFSEAVGFWTLLMYNLICSAAYIITNLLFQYPIKNQRFADFVTNLIFFLLSVTMVFGVLKMDDPNFKNEDAKLFVDYFKGFVMPLIFFPFLSYLTIKPLFGKN